MILDGQYGGWGLGTGGLTWRLAGGPLHAQRGMQRIGRPSSGWLVILLACSAHSASGPLSCSRQRQRARVSSRLAVCGDESICLSVRLSEATPQQAQCAAPAVSPQAHVRAHLFRQFKGELAQEARQRGCEGHARRVDAVAGAQPIGGGDVALGGGFRGGGVLRGAPQQTQRSSPTVRTDATSYERMALGPARRVSFTAGKGAPPRPPPPARHRRRRRRHPGCCCCAAAPRRCREGPSTRHRSPPSALAGSRRGAQSWPRC